MRAAFLDTALGHTGDACGPHSGTRSVTSAGKPAVVSIQTSGRCLLGMELAGQQPYWPQPLLLPLAALCTVGHWLHSPATIAQERKAQARRCSHLPRAEARQREQAGGSALQKEELQLGEKDSSDY